MNSRAASHVRIWLAVLLVFGSCGVAFVVGIAPAGASEESRQSEVCLDCHEDFDVGLRATPHRLSAGELDDPSAWVACTDCHPGDANHYEEDPEEYPLVNPADLSPDDAAQLCATCHMNSHQQNMLEGNVHARNEVNCSGCHQVHGGYSRSLLRAEETSLCLDCHTAVASHFARPSRHPVADGVVTCSDCHATLDVTQRELSRIGANATCTSCHGEFEGPFPFEHQATLDYSSEEGGCLNCHDPHGSYIARLLKQPYEAPSFQLCSQCHSVPGHRNNAMHGTMWADVPCSDCHTDTHGSYVSRLFLTEELEPQGCFNAFCHDF